MNAVRSQARLQSLKAGPATSANTAMAVPSQMINDPPTINAPSTHTSQGHANTLRLDHGHLQHLGYPSLYPTAPTLPPDFHLRQSWHSMNPLRASLMHTIAPEPRTPAAGSAVRVSRELSPADGMSYPVISHGPADHDSSFRAGDAVPVYSTAAAAADQQALRGLPGPQHVGYLQPHIRQSSDMSAVMYWPVADQRSAPTPWPQDAFESGELVPGTFSPLETALLRSQVAATQVSIIHPTFSPLRPTPPQPTPPHSTPA